MKLISRIGIAIGVGILVIALLGLGAYIDAPKHFHVLIIGSDQRDTEQARSDVLMLFSVPKNPDDGAQLLTIPRDTRVAVPGHGEQKITHAYALGDRPEDAVLGNLDLVVATVEEFLGLEIHVTLEFTFESFKDIVDAEGGVMIGGERMDGEAALLQVRNRFREGGDFARAEDQRSVFLALFDRIQSISDVRRFQGYINDSDQARLVYTPGPTYQFAFAAGVRRYGKFTIGDVTTEVVPGHGANIYTPEFGKELYYWVPDEEGLAETLKTK